MSSFENIQDWGQGRGVQPLHDMGDCYHTFREALSSN